MRARLLESAAARVLEVAAGTGANLPHYGAGVDIAAVDLGPVICSPRLGNVGRVKSHGSEALGSRDCSLILWCPRLRPARCRTRFRRYGRCGGRSWRAHSAPGARAQQPSENCRVEDRLAPNRAAHLGCRWNRDPLAMIRRAGLQPRIAERRFLGMLYIVHI
jgi:hypothetical protein